MTDKEYYLTFHGYTLGSPEAEEAWAAKEAMTIQQAGYHIISEEKNYKPYKSMKTGEIVDGRKQHREHLKRHGLVEVGNEQPKARKQTYDSSGLKEAIARQIYR
jgi:hypothetical protein